MNIIISDKKNKLLIYLLIIVGSISLFCLSFNIFKEKSLPTSSSSHSISAILEDVQAINNKCNSFCKNGDLDCELALKNISNIKTNLSKLKNNLSSSDEKQKSLITALDNNILIYDQMYSMLKNSKASDIEVSSKNLRTYHNTANNIYSNLGNNNVLKDTFYAIESTINYCFENNVKNKEKDIKNDQAALFVSSLDTIISSFEKSMEDLNSLTKDARNNKITYELAISKVDDKIKSLESFNSELRKLSIPNKGTISYEKLISSLNEYDNYLASFKYALSMEKMYSDNKEYSNDFFDSLYSTSKDYLNSFQTYYDKFKNSYFQYKSDVL